MTLSDRVVRTVLWKLNAKIHKPMYAYIARHADDDVLFMNWAYEEDSPMPYRWTPATNPTATPSSSTTPPQPKAVD